MIEFTTSLFMLASAFMPNGAEATTTVNQTIAEPSATSTIVMSTSTPMTIAQTEAYVREYFSDTPILAEIARCESSFRQIDGKTGEVLRGKVNSGDVGVMQINKYYHEEDAQKLGIDIYTLEGNLKFAEILYGKYGAKPWVSSSKCWKNSTVIDTSSIAKI
jgi:hypothetical protein